MLEDIWGLKIFVCMQRNREMIATVVFFLDLSSIAKNSIGYVFRIKCLMSDRTEVYQKDSIVRPPQKLCQQ